jgi:hypothetical protein
MFLATNRSFYLQFSSNLSILFYSAYLFVLFLLYVYTCLNWYSLRSWSKVLTFFFFSLCIRNLNNWRVFHWIFSIIKFNYLKLNLMIQLLLGMILTNKSNHYRRFIYTIYTHIYKKINFVKNSIQIILESNNAAFCFICRYFGKKNSNIEETWS